MMIEQDRPGKIFVGGLSTKVDREVLENSFGKYGRITEILIIRDKITNTSRGYGFITYENPLDAEDAVKAMDGETINGKEIHVEQAVRSVHSDRGGGMMRSSRGGSMRSRGGFASRSRGSMSGRYDSRESSPRRMDSRRGSPPPRRGATSYRGRGRGGPPIRSSSYGRRELSPPPRKAPIMHSSSMSRRGPSYNDSPPPRRVSTDYIDRRDDRYGSSSFSERVPMRSRDTYPPSPPRDTSRGLMDSRNSSGRVSRDYQSSRDYLPQREYNSRNFSPEREPVRSRQIVQRDSYDRRDSFTRSSGGRDYMAPRSGGDYMPSRDSSRDYTTSRGYESTGRDMQTSRDQPYREYGSRLESHSMGGSSSGRYSSRDPDSRPAPSRAPVSRSYDSFDEAPSSRGYQGTRGPSFSSRGGSSSGVRRDSGAMAGSRRPAPPMSRGPPQKRSRMDGPPPKRGGAPFRR